MSKECSYRKDYLRSKRINNKRDFASATKSAPVVGVPDNGDVAKSLSCILLVTLSTLETPESFSDEINKLFKLNGLPTLIAVDRLSTIV